MTTLQEEFETAIIMITHDLGVVAEIADDVVVMYAGKVAEEGTVDEIFTRPHHPYTWGLLGSLPRLDADVERLVQIQGSPPSLLNPPRGCRFHPRCPYVLDVCNSVVPQLLPVSNAPQHLQACHLDEETKDREVAEAARRHAGGGVVTGEDLLVVEDLVKHFPVTRGIVFQKQVASVKAVDGISFTVKQGETLGVVGESGCGKSTMARCLMRLLDPTSGRITFAGRDITHLSRTEMRPIRRELMMIFQDPYASLNQRKRVGFIVAEALQVHRIGTPAEIKRRVQELLEVVGLNPEHYNRFPHEFSGGQRQRIGVARALAVNPKLIVCDEPVSALDVSVQAQILNLLKDLQRDFGLTYVFIAHDLNVVRHISDRVLVMYLGKVAEIADRNQLYAAAEASYTGALLSAVPIPNPELGRLRRPIVLEGDVPSPINPPEACRFHPRCPRFRARALRRRRAAAARLRRRARRGLPLPARALADVRRGDPPGGRRSGRGGVRRRMLVAAARRFFMLLGAIAGGTAVLSLLLGLLLGRLADRSVAVGLYLVGLRVAARRLLRRQPRPVPRRERGGDGRPPRAARRCASPRATSRRSRST